MALAGLNMAAFNDWLKEHYINRRSLDDLLYGKDPFLRDIKKLPATRVVDGKQIIVPLRLSRTPNMSRDFAVAQSKAKSRTGARERFVIDVDKDFGVARIENATAYASKKDTGAFIYAFKDEMDDVLRSVSNRRSQDLVGQGDSVKGRVASVNGSRTVITITQADQDINFDIGDTIQFSASTAGTALKRVGATAADTVATISRVRRGTDTTTLTLTAALHTGNTVVANDYIFMEGDAGENSLKGLGAWIPDSDPSSTAFFGVDRTQDLARLSGFRDAAVAGDRIESLIRQMNSKIFRTTKSSADSCWLNPETFNKVVDSAMSNLRYNTDGAANKNTLQFGFSDITIQTAGGPVMVKTSPYMPLNKAYLLKMDSWALYYIAAEGGRFVDFIKNNDGSMWKQSHDDASVEVRVESYGALACHAPGCNGVITGLNNIT